MIVEGLPSGLPLEAGMIDRQLARRQQGYGRGGRMKIERDRVQIMGGVRHGLTLGSPLAMIIPNLDWENWKTAMGAESSPGGGNQAVTSPRPGHADLAGGMKHGFSDLRNVLERASARETAARVAAGAAFMALLEQFGMVIYSFVEEIGGEKADLPGNPDREDIARAEASPFRCPDPGADERFRTKVDEAREAGDSLGGIFLVTATGLVPGLGSHAHWDRRLDGRLAGTLMSIPGIKGVEVGLGFRGAALTGTAFHDEIVTGEGKAWKYRRRTNRAGGLEGGITNGEDLVVRAFMKPIPTTVTPLASVDLETGEEVPAHKERSDVCAVPAAAVVGEAMCAYALAEAVLEKFGGDSLEETMASCQRYTEGLGRY